MEESIKCLLISAVSIVILIFGIAAAKKIIEELTSLVMILYLIIKGKK